MEERISALGASSDGSNKQDLYEVSEWNGTSFVSKMKSFLQLLKGFKTGKILYVDSVIGNDGDATGDRFLPFATISAAQSFTTFGDTLDIRGDFNESGLGGVDGINYYFHPGSTLTGSGLFSDFGSAISFNILGFGTFNGGTNVLTTSNPLSEVTFQAYNVSATGCFLIEDGTVRIDCIKDIISTTAPCIRIGVNAPNAPTVIVNCRYIISDRICLFGSTHGAGASPDGYVTIYAKKIFLGQTAPYSGLATECGTWNLHCDFESEATSFGLAVGSFDGVGGTINVYGKCTFNNGYAISCRNVNSTMNFYGEIEAVSTMINTAGFLHFRNKVSNNRQALEAITHSGGKTYIYGMVKNLDSNAASDGIKVSTSGLVLKQGAIIWCTGAAKSVNSVAAQTIKTYGGAVANVALSVNITEQVGNIAISGNVDSE